MPSLQEGFGLPYLEAAALGKPLLARALPDVSANLSALGCQLSGTYAMLAVATNAFDRTAEQGRIATRRGHLPRSLPAEMAAAVAAGPGCLDKADVDFGGLTLEAQLEVLQSGSDPDPFSLQPEVPFWPEHRRREGWADRFDMNDAPGGPAVDSPQGALLPEVLRRFRGWLEHPLLWP